MGGDEDVAGKEGLEVYEGEVVRGCVEDLVSFSTKTFQDDERIGREWEGPYEVDT